MTVPPAVASIAPMLNSALLWTKPSMMTVPLAAASIVPVFCAPLSVELNVIVLRLSRIWPSLLTLPVVPALNTIEPPDSASMMPAASLVMPIWPSNVIAPLLSASMMPSLVTPPMS